MSSKKKTGRKSLTQTTGSSPHLKPKKSDAEVVKCSYCEVIFLKADVEVHSQAHKSSGMPEGPLPNLENLARIQAQQLHATAVKLPKKEDQRSLLETHQDPLLVSPIAAHLCRLKFGHLASVTHPDGQQMLHTVVPSDSLPNPLSVAILSTNMAIPSSVGTMVRVAPYLEVPQPAHYLCLEPLTDVSEDFPLQLQLLYNLSFICKGMILIPWEGVRLRVVEIHGTPDLCSSIQHLSLDPGTSQFFQLRFNTILSLNPPSTQPHLNTIQGLPPDFKNILSQHPKDWPSGVMLTGPDGSGKSTTFRAIQAHTSYHCINIREEYLWNDDSFEDTLEKVQRQAIQKAPSIVLFPHLDILYPRKESTEALSLDVLAIERMFDSIENHPSQPAVLFVGSATVYQSVDSLLQSIFGPPHEIGLPTDLPQILRDISERYQVVLSPEEQSIILTKNLSCTGGDLESIFLHAEVLAKGKLLSSASVVEESNNLKPAAMENNKLQVPKVSWSDIGGMEDVKHILKSRIATLKSQPVDLVHPLPILLYGPPGCSKTLLAKAMASECQLNFFNISGTDIVSKYMGDTEQNIFRLFEQARANRPALIFFDEFDSLCMKSSSEAEKLVDKITLVLVNEIKKSAGVLFIAATNLPSKLNKNFLSHLSIKILVPLPDKDSRVAIFSLHLQNVALRTDVEVDSLAEHSNGFSGAEIVGACKMASYAAISENPADPPPVSQQHLLDAIKATVPMATPELLAIYKELNEVKN